MDPDPAEEPVLFAPDSRGEIKVCVFVQIVFVPKQFLEGFGMPAKMQRL
jgi:hypothetical protein